MNHTKASDITARIDWDPQTLTLIQPGGCYSRMIRLQSGQLLCGYEFLESIWVRHSVDEGRTWQEPVRIADSTQASLTNIDLLQLRNGSVLCFYNQRPHPTHEEEKHGTKGAEVKAAKVPFAIGLIRSEDSGQSWKGNTCLYSAGSEWANGCWEPSGIQLPSGEVQVYFANEGPYRQSDEQEITLLRSYDNGCSWSHPETASFRAGFRDGMPVPLVLEGGRGIALAIEDNGLSGSTKPVIVFTTLEDNWYSGVVGANSTRRRGALRILLDPPIYAGAPYLRQMPSGETLLSFQQSNAGNQIGARMVVCIGDTMARNFAAASHPFPQAPGTSQLWNSLFVKDSDTLTAVSSTTIKSIYGVWAIDGRFHVSARQRRLPRYPYCP